MQISGPNLDIGILVTAQKFAIVVPVGIERPPSGAGLAYPAGLAPTTQETFRRSPAVCLAVVIIRKTSTHTPGIGKSITTTRVSWWEA